ncbi:MAG: transporter, family, tartrate transporter [Acidobacteriota bacterium]|nr:transporter, family, tartrate transporter [Acidobacteriota bacterium]MDT7779234.1 transporter, family, tartrate transporter [Acidobacteriota bacterium]
MFPVRKAAELLTSDEAVAESARRRITRRLMPFLICLFMIAFLDRVNLGYAALEMGRDLGFDTEVLGFGAGIFFVGYFLLEIPGTLLVENWSARLWLARIIISWGLLAVLTGFIQNSTQFYIARFVLGAAEAGFFPGVIVYLSHWFRTQDRAKAVAMFMAAIPVSNIFGAPVSGLILGVHWLGLAGWRWVFILEGLPALIFGVVTIFYLTDWPRDAGWLTTEEREWITNELEREKSARRAERTYSVWEAVKHRNVLLLALAYFCSVTSAYGFNFWLPTIVKGLSGLSNLLVTSVAALPYCAGLAAMLLVGWTSDRTGERRWHTAVSLLVVSLGLVLSAVANQRVGLAVGMFCLAGAGLYSYLPGFWALPTAFLTESAAAVAVGLINSVGNLGGFVGPYVVGYLTKSTGSFYAGVIYLSCSALASACLILCVRHTSQPVKR